MKNLFGRFHKDKKGATAIEYGLIAALISIVIIGATRNLGSTLSTGFGTINTQVSGAINGTGAGAGAGGTSD